MDAFILLTDLKFTASLFQQIYEFFRCKRFGAKTVEKPLLKQPRPFLFICSGRQDEYTVLALDSPCKFGKFVEELEPVHARHVQIGKNDTRNRRPIFGKIVSRQ